MTSQHLDELARLLGGQASLRASGQLPSSEAPSVSVDGYGELRLPLTAAQVKKLITHGEPAPYGKGEVTLLDRSVRHTWHFPQAKVEVDWHGRLDTVLDEARSVLCLPTSCRLEAQFHSLLVYERDQFFAPHQDSEKDDAMVASLVVVLPCPFSGGELVVHGGDGTETYPGSRTETTIVAFYADALHEVLPVRTGHRIALTYNLLLSGDTSDRPVSREDIADAETLLTRHFTTPMVPRYGGEPYLPQRVAYLLDHSYTPKSLANGMSRLKGVDAERAAILREAAQAADARSCWPWPTFTRPATTTATTEARSTSSTPTSRSPTGSPPKTPSSRSASTSASTRSRPPHPPSCCAPTTNSTRATWATTATRWTGGTTAARCSSGPIASPSQTAWRPRPPPNFAACSCAWLTVTTRP